MSFLTFITCLNVILTSKNACALVFSNLYPKTGGWQASLYSRLQSTLSSQDRLSRIYHKYTEGRSLLSGKV